MLYAPSKSYYDKAQNNQYRTALDCITTPAPETRVDYGLSTTKGSGERSRLLCLSLTVVQSPFTTLSCLGVSKRDVLVARVISSIGICNPERLACGWGWKPPDIHAGSNGCWQSWGSNCGSETPRRLRPDESASRRPIPTTPDFC